MNSLEPGQEYEISVWCRGNLGNTYLVATSVSTDLFYINSNISKTKDDKGWQNLKLRFHINQENIADGIKVYVWNNSTETVYLDDFVIQRLE